MKIAVLTPTFSHFSGIDRVVELETKELIEKGNDAKIYTFKADLKTNIKVVEIGMPKNPTMERLYRLFFFLDFKKVNKYFNEIKNFDEVHSHFYPMNILAYKAKKKNPKIRYVFRNYGVGITESYSFFGKIYLKIFNYLQNKTIKNCDEAVSISEYLRKELEKETGIKGAVRYIKIDKKRFHSGIDGSKIKKKYDVKGPLLLYVGRISPHKGVHLLIKAFGIVNEKAPNARLVIIGKPTFKKYFDELKKLANENVIFAGFVSDEELPCYYAACDLYTTATLWEGYDMPVAEAQECGKKVVAFDIGAHLETVKNGVLVKKGDIKEFADSILKEIKI